MSVNDDRERILELLLCGDLSVNDPQAKHLFETDPDARVEYEELKAIEQALTRGAGDARDVIAESSELEDTPGEAGLLTALREQRAPRARSARTWLVPLTAAAALLLLWSPWKQVAVPVEESAGEPRQEQLMGSARIALQKPVGDVDSMLPFTWTGELEDGGWFEVWVYDADSIDADVFLESGTLLQSAWSPEGITSWPARIRWTVALYGASGNVQESRSAEASLRR